MSTTEDAGYTPKQKLYVLLIVVSKLIHQLSSFWPCIILPLEGNRRNFSAVEIGATITSMSIVAWITSAILSAKFISFGGKKACYYLFVTGSFLYAILNMLIPSAQLFHDNRVFGIIIFVVFSLRGAAQSMYLASVNTIIINEFPNHVQKTKGIDTEAYTVGSLCSLVVTGFLYKYFGFTVVLLIMGSSQFICSVFYAILLPRETQCQEKSKETSSKPVLWDLIKICDIQLTLICHASAYMSLYFMTPIFTIFLTNQFKISTAAIGMIGCLPYLSMASFSLIWGKINFNAFWRKICITVALILFFPTSCITGPDPLLGIEHSLILFCLMFAFGGMLISTNLVLNLGELKHIAEVNAFDLNSLTVTATISNLLTLYECIGELIGPLLGGFLEQLFGFERAIALGGLILGFCGALKLLLYFIESKKIKKCLVGINNENRSLPCESK